MSLNSYTRRVVIFAGAVFLSLSSARAERLAVVAHPDTGLTEADVQFPRENETWYLKALTLLPPLFVSSPNVRDAPGERAFVLVLEKPRAQVVNHTAHMVPGGSKSDKTREYRTIFVVATMGFRLCYRTDAGGDLAELGRGVVWGEASQMNLDEDENRDHYEKVPYKISNETPEELTHRALRVAVQDIPRLISHVVTPHVLVPETQPLASADEVIAWAKKIPATYSWKVDTKVMNHNSREMLKTRITNNFSHLKPKPQYSGAYEARYHPSRVTKNPDGSLNIEVDLWNRLPVRVAGMLYRNASEQEEDLHDASSAAAPVTNEKRSSAFMEKRDRAVEATFDLAPGEKKVATFHVAPEWAVDPALIRNDIILGSIRKLGLMAERSEKQPHPPPKRKSRK